MPPRLPALASFGFRSTPIASPWASFLLPFLQSRSASILSSLSDNPSAYPRASRIRRGRGPSSGKGKTSGRGHKGQRQHGKVPFGFQGGQTPDYVVHGERGFTNQYASTTRGPIVKLGLIIIQVFPRNVSYKSRSHTVLD